MATPAEIDMITRLRDALLRIATPAQRTADPGANQAIADASNWLINPDLDVEGGKPVYGYAVGSPAVHYMVDERRRVWRLDTTTTPKKFVLL